MMDMGVLRVPVAVLTALAVLAAGCAQRVSFVDPPGATVVVNGQSCGAIPCEAKLPRDHALTLELRASPELLAGIQPPSGARGLKGILVLPDHDASVVTFGISAAEFRAALESGAAVCVRDFGPSGTVLFFKGSVTGVDAHDAEVKGLLPAQENGGFLGTLAEIGEVTLLVVIVAVVIVGICVVNAACGSSEDSSESYGM